MPSIALTSTTENVARIIAAISPTFPPEGEETNAEHIKRFVRKTLTDVVYAHEVSVASGNVSADENVAE